MKWTKIALGFGMAGPILLLLTLLISSSSYGLFAISASAIAGLGALVTGIIALAKEGKSKEVLFALIIGGIWVHFGLFTLIFVLPTRA